MSHLTRLLDYFAAHEDAAGEFCPGEVFDEDQMRTIVESATVLPSGFRIRFYAETAMAEATFCMS